MSDDIFIKHGLGSFQQPYNARQPSNGQEPNIRAQQEPNIRNIQEPNIRAQQEPNIRNYQHPTTYNHRSPTTYNHRSPSTYQHRSPSYTQASYQSRQPVIYQHQSPSTYRHPVIYQHPGTYNHRSPFTYNHRSPFTYNHRSPFTYQARQPDTYNHRSPFTYVHRSPLTYVHRSPYIYQHQSPYISQVQNPFIRNNQTPYIANSQSPTIGTTPIIYDAIDGDTTGPGGSTSGWGPLHSQQDWDTFQTRFGASGQQQAFANFSFAYQHTTTTPLSGNSSAGTQGDVEVSWNGGTNAAMATTYYDFIQLYDNGQAPTIDDTWAWDVKWDAVANTSINTYGSQNGSYGPSNQTHTGGPFTRGAYYAVYAGSSSSGSYNGTRTHRQFSWLAQTNTSTNGLATVTNMGANTFTVRITKSGQTTIYTSYGTSNTGVNMAATLQQGGGL